MDYCANYDGCAIVHDSLKCPMCEQDIIFLALEQEIEDLKSEIEVLKENE
jgi:hypothetical protein